MSQTTTIDRLPPHAPDMEMGVLGCILISPQDCMGECIGKLPAGAFYDLRHQTIYDVLVEMYDSRAQIDIITVQQRLKDNQLLEQVGGIAYLSSLPDVVPSAANLSYYMESVKEKYLLRQTITVCTHVVGRIYDFEGDVDVLMDEVERDILKISESRVSKETPEIKELVKRALVAIEDMHQRHGAVSGLAAGFIDLDRMTGGLHPGEMIVIAARPSMGKTSLAMNIAEHIAVDNGLPVGVFSLEMTAEALTLRMVCSRARLNTRELRDGRMVQGDFPKLTTAAGKLAKAPLFIDDSSGLSILQLRAKARRMHQMHGIKALVIDYLQLLHTTNRRAKNRQEEITDISNGCKSLAKELNIPVIVLSQLNRELEKDKNRKPRMSDLRESGAIEQDADVIGMLYRPADDKEEEPTEQDAVPINLLIAKQRNGPTGDCPLVFFRNITRFETASKIKDEDQQ